MRTGIKISLTTIFFGAVLALISSPGWAAVAIQAEVVSGTIVQIDANHSIQLDNGKIYQPSRPGLDIDLQAGKPVTLRYLVEGEGKNVFFEAARGLNSLQKNVATPPRKENSPK